MAILSIFVDSKCKKLTSRYKKIISYTLKAAVVFFAFWFIYVKLSESSSLKEFEKLIADIPDLEISLIMGAVVLLMFVNWGLEALKWQMLIAKAEEISFWKAVESVFCGLTWAVFTPNRIGEYGGRVFFLSPRRRITGVVAMAVGNLSQMVLTNVFGAVCLCIFINRYVEIDEIVFYASMAICLIFCSFFILFYFNIRWLNGLLLSLKWTRKYKRFYGILGRYRKKELLSTLLYSFGRYAVFSTQYFIVFNWLIPQIPGPSIVMMVCILFFVQSILPSLDLLDIGVRSAAASYFFGFVTDQSVAVIACTASIWLINIILPAVLGTYFVFKLNFFGSLQRD